MSEAEPQLTELVVDEPVSWPDHLLGNDGCPCGRPTPDGRHRSVRAVAGQLTSERPSGECQFPDLSAWGLIPEQRRIAERMVARICPAAWVIHDMPLPKGDKKSVGVARQYCAVLGRQADCQIAASIHAVSEAASCPLQWRLFLPAQWASDAERRAKAQVPEGVGYREKWLLALDMLDTLAGWGMAPPVMVASTDYGQSPRLRAALERRGVAYVFAVPPDLVVHPRGAVPAGPLQRGGASGPQLARARRGALSVAALGARLDPAACCEIAWCPVSGPMRSRFAALRVRPVGTAGHLRLLVEWPPGDEAPTGYWLSNLPLQTPLGELVRLAKISGRMEHDQRQLARDLDLDCFGGRSWPGWLHHVTLVTAAHAFRTEKRLSLQAVEPVSCSAASPTPSRAPGAPDCWPFGLPPHSQSARTWTDPAESPERGGAS